MPADEKKESLYIKPEHIRAIFNLAGIVMPALLPDGQVVGKRKKKNKKVSVTLFGEIHTKQKSLIAESAGSLWDDIASIGFTR